MNQTFGQYLGSRWGFFLIVFVHALRGTENMNGFETFLSMGISGLIILAILYGVWSYQNKKNNL